MKDIFTTDFVKLIISNKIKKDHQYKKIIIKPVLIKGIVKYNVESYTEKQVFHQNLDLQQVEDFMKAQFQTNFKQMDCFKRNETTIYKANKDKVFKTTTKTEERSLDLSHDRKKRYYFSEGTIIPPLVDIGIMDKDGKIIKSMYHKYKQIERFLEIIDDSIKDEKQLNIIDFGCGKSYLTFILYYFLTNIKQIEIKMIGLDLKEEVIKNCNEISRRYGYNNLSFQLGNIAFFKGEFKPDMIVTLHACDTATDYALNYAIKENTKYIFSVPCCQHEINKQFKKKDIISKYGIFKERLSSIITDAIRANILEYYGYTVDVLEFVDFDLTPKNILLRATKTNKRVDNIKEIELLLEQYEITHTLYDLTIKQE